MLPKIVRVTLSVSTAVILLALATGPQARAGDPRSHWGNLVERCTECNKTLSKDVYYSDFYGYYRTCWRRWPNTQPPCPPCLPPGSMVVETPTTEKVAPAPTDDQKSLPEVLPTPKPEADKK